jgi:hypothetical protein
MLQVLFSGFWIIPEAGGMGLFFPFFYKLQLFIDLKETSSVLRYVP